MIDKPFVSRRVPVGGIEPGSLRGLRPDNPVLQSPEDSNDVHRATLKEIGALSALDFIKWKKQEGNSQRMAAALKFKREQKENE